MIILSILSLLLSNAVNLRRDIAILYNRIAIFILTYCILNDLASLSVITKGIGLHGGLLLINNVTQIFHIFVFLITILILTLTRSTVRLSLRARGATTTSSTGSANHTHSTKSKAQLRLHHQL